MSVKVQLEHGLVLFLEIVVNIVWRYYKNMLKYKIQIVQLFYGELLITDSYAWCGRL